MKSLGGKRVVEGIDLTCHSGEVLGLLGPNGGKTTTLCMCYGLPAPTRTDSYRRPRSRHRRRCRGVALWRFCTQDNTFDSEFTVRGNLVQTGDTTARGRMIYQKRIDQLIERFGLGPFANQNPRRFPAASNDG